MNNKNNSSDWISMDLNKYSSPQQIAAMKLLKKFNIPVICSVVAVSGRIGTVNIKRLMISDRQIVRLSEVINEDLNH